MNNAKHTPGPWEKYRTDKYPNRPFQIMGNGKKNGPPIAEIILWDTNTDEARANLNLIAAAPDLLEALDPFAKFACSPPGECECFNCIARAAIAKAEGRTDDQA